MKNSFNSFKNNSLPDISYFRDENTNKNIGFRYLNGIDTPLVFLHGFNGSSKSWAFQFSYFFKKNKVIAIDFPGFGSSEHFDYTMESLADKFNSLLDSLNVKKYFLIGQSMGGQLAQLMAIKYEKNLKGLVLCCTHTGYGASINEPLPKNRIERINERIKLDNKQFGDLRIQKMLPNLNDSKLFNFLSKIAGEVTIEGIESGSKAMHCLDTTSFLSKLDTPCLIITSEFDSVVPHEKSKKLINTIKNNMHIQLPNVGHAPYCEDHQKFNQIVENFLINSNKK